MDETMENAVINPTDSDPILPDGWDGQSDIFADADTSEEKSLEELFKDFGNDATEQTGTAPTTEPAATETQETTETASTEAPTTEQTETGPRKLRFKAKYNHQEQDVELDESDLANVYQKSLFADSLQEKLKKAEAELAGYDELAKAMKYGGRSEMMDTARNNYRQAEIDRLMEDGASEEVATFIVETRLGNKPATPAQEEPVNSNGQPADGQTAPAPKRDFESEVRELVTAHPELKGSGPLPQEVVDAAIKGGKHLVAAYEGFAAEKAKAEADKLRNENQILRQNAASAARAPVTGVTGGGATDTKPTDPFLEGFNSSYYR